MGYKELGDKYEFCLKARKHWSTVVSRIRPFIALM
jgi:hypothetical protein